MNHTTQKQNFIVWRKNKFLRLLQIHDIVQPMTKDDQYFTQVFAFAHKQAGSYSKLAKALGVPNGPAVQMWRVNGVAHKWRPVLEKKYGAAFRKSLQELVT
jgi:hypothetical protein